jgi:rubrerythrin
MAEALYNKLYRRLEPVRWSLAEVPFDRVERDKVSRDTLDFVRVNALMELSSLYATRMFLRDFRHDTDFCQFMSIWYFEEMRHYLVLCEYLKCFGLEPQPEELPALDTELKEAPWAPTLAMHWCGELRLGIWYLRWAESVEEEEPVLAGIFRTIAEDEYRHAQCYEDFMHRALEREPALLLDFLNTAKWMLVNPQGDKHPTTFAEGSVDGLAVSDHIAGYEAFLRRVQDNVTAADEERLERRILKTLSRLSGRELTRRADLVRLTRELAAGRAAAPGAR